jgi:exodeoxyribonuclease VII large subunit
VSGTALTVSQLTAIVREAVMARPELEDILVEGEISNLTAHSSGHIYLTLKDARSQLGCAVFRTAAQRIPFKPGNGMRVIAHGHVEVYEQQGRYQLIVDRLEPVGVGALALAVEQRRKALAAEGLFDAAAKRPLPLLPRRIVVVTSRTGAAVRDVLTVTARRAPCVDVVLSPATVQGDGAVETLLTAMRRAHRVRGAEVILLVRGGGSLEDLMAFNDERIARAIRLCRLPVVTGIGHETDTTIADLAADHRAATPSAAAESAVPDCGQLRQQLMDRKGRLQMAVRQELRHKRTASDRLRLRLENQSPLRRLPGLRQDVDMRVARLRGALLGNVAQHRRRADAATARLRATSPERRLELERQALGSRRRRLDGAVTGLAATARSDLAARRSHLEALSPLRTLERGYSITMDAETGRVADPATLHVGQALRTRLAGGVVESRVEGVDTGGERMYDTGAPGEEEP